MQLYIDALKRITSRRPAALLSFGQTDLSITQVTVDTYFKDPIIYVYGPGFVTKTRYVRRRTNND